jgi:tRNA threonylcarbamoyladenosine biosynthesis protein TsaE
VIESRKKLYLVEKSLSPEQTKQIAGKFAYELKPTDIVAFYGDLGSGKTFFIKALCKSLRTKQEATSPSFTIINEYYTFDGLCIFHFDFYRLEEKGELQNLGLDDFFFDNNICFIEWADKIVEFLPSRRWEVHLSFIRGTPYGRKIKITKLE